MARRQDKVNRRGVGRFDSSTESGQITAEALMLHDTGNSRTRKFSSCDMLSIFADVTASPIAGRAPITV